MRVHMLLTGVLLLQVACTMPEKARLELPAPAAPMETAKTSHAGSRLQPAEANPLPSPSSICIGLPSADIEQAQAEARRIYERHWPRIRERSRFVLHRMRKVMLRLGVPDELLAVPVVESAFNPYALSHAGAMGLWQLMPATAKGLGLRKDLHIDGRRDVERCTEAAVTYLLQLYDQFGNWPLAFAAYHLGPGALAKRLARHSWRPEDGLGSLPVPSVTQRYVRNIVGLAELLHQGVFSFPQPIETRTLEIKGPIDLARLAQLAGMREDDLFRFNPGLKYSQILDGSLRIHVPISNYADMMAHLPDARPRYIHVKVQPGDSLWKIARRHGVTLKDLRSLNPRAKRLLRPGQTLRVPATRSFHLAQARANPLLTKGRRIRYRVRPGDSLWKIARRFSTSTRAIARINGIRNPRSLRPGDHLWILARN